MIELWKNKCSFLGGRDLHVNHGDAPYLSAPVIKYLSDPCVRLSTVAVP